MSNETTARPMPYDDATPPCRFCGAEHVGTHEPSYITIRGSYMFVPKLGYEMFILDPKNKVALQTLPNGWQALVIDIDPLRRASSATHESCQLRAVEALYVLGHLPDTEVDPEILEQEEWPEE